jgi:hypothetical protein
MHAAIHARAQETSRAVRKVLAAFHEAKKQRGVRCAGRGPGGARSLHEPPSTRAG